MEVVRTANYSILVIWLVNNLQDDQHDGRFSKKVNRLKDLSAAKSYWHYYNQVGNWHCE